MTRVIKFKIWDTVEKKFLSLKDYQNLGAIEVENDGTLTLSPRFRFLTSMMIMPERFIPLQYTGLKDKNGKEIYEGDIISYIIGLQDGESIEEDGVVVEFDYEQLFQLRCADYIEVIGNIYESEVEDVKD